MNPGPVRTPITFDVPHDPSILPPGLPEPKDDGLAAHLLGASLPRIGLRSTSGPWVNLAAFDRPTVLFFFPRTGVPGQPPAPGFQGEDWDSIPGARGCTPQSCAFRDLHDDFKRLGVSVYGISTSTTEHQREFKSRNHVPYELLSDSELTLVHAMKLPTFRFPVESGGPDTLIKRMAWYVDRPHQHNAAPRVEHLWYPVFPPDQNAAQVLAWVKARLEVHLRPIGSDDLTFVRAELKRHWNATSIWSIGREYKADRLPGFIAWCNGQPIGLITVAMSAPCPEGEAEVVTLSTVQEGRGVGGMLLDAAVQAAREAGKRRIFLTTSNDNVRALAFYQRRGWSLVQLHRGAIDRYRAGGWKLPAVAENGIPIRDELELELPIA